MAAEPLLNLYTLAIEDARTFPDTATAYKPFHEGPAPGLDAYTPGDLVAVASRGRIRVAVVETVGRKLVGVVYVTPSGIRQCKELIACGQWARDARPVYTRLRAQLGWLLPLKVYTARLDALEAAPATATE